MAAMKRVRMTPAWGRRRVAVLCSAIAAAMAATAGLLGNLEAIGRFVNALIHPRQVDLMLSLSQENQPFDADNQKAFYEQAYEVKYEAEVKNGTIVVNHTSAYFHEPLHPTGDVHFRLPRVGLDIKIINKTDSPIYLNEVTLHVERSMSDTRPLVVVENVSGGSMHSLRLYNEGWGRPPKVRAFAKVVGAPAELVELLSNLRRCGGEEPLEEKYSEAAEGESSGASASSDEGCTSDENAFQFDVAPLLKQAGVPLPDPSEYQRLRAAIEDARWPAQQAQYGLQPGQVPAAGSAGAKALARFDRLVEELDALWAPAQIACVRALGGRLFGWHINPTQYPEVPTEELMSRPVDCLAPLVGVLQVESVNPEGLTRIEAQQFVGEVLVTPRGDRGRGGFEPTGAYDIGLRPDGTSYRVSKNISQPVEAGKVDRFILWLGAERSSVHDFVVELSYNDGLVKSRPIHLSYVMPRSNRKVLDEHAKDQQLVPYRFDGHDISEQVRQ